MSDNQAHASVEAIEAAMAAGEAAASAPEADAEAVEGTGEGTGTGAVSSAEYDALKAEFEAFKRRTALVSAKYAKRHDLCSVVDSALGELGLRRPVSVHRNTVTLSITWDTHGTSGRRSAAPSESYLWAQFRDIANAMRYNNDRDQVTRQNSDAMPGLVIRTAEVTTEHISDGSYLIEAGPVVKCYNCSRENTVTIDDPVCSACGYDNGERD